MDSFIEYTEKSKESYQDWMVGNADYRRKRLCVLSPRVVCDRSFEEMMKVMIHEIVHIAMDSLADADEVELWISEGIAILYAGIYVWYFIEKFGFDTFKRVYMGLDQTGKYLYPGFESEAVITFLKRGQ